MLGFLSVDDEPEQYLFAARLRPRNTSSTREVTPLLWRTVAQLRQVFPRAEIRVRLDAGFASPAVLDQLDRLRIGYLVTYPANAALDFLAGGLLCLAKVEAYLERRSVRHSGWEWHRAQSWRRDRRVIFKAEALWAEGKELEGNLRFVVTNLRGKPEHLYQLYCRRGDSENRLKELKRDLELDRTSCHRFVANPFRVLLTAASYVLLQELRFRLRRTELARCRISTTRLALLKIGVRVIESVRRVLVRAPTAYPWQDVWRRLALSLGAVSI